MLEVQRTCPTHHTGADVGHFKSHPLFSRGGHSVTSCSLRQQPDLCTLPVSFPTGEGEEGVRGEGEGKGEGRGGEGNIYTLCPPKQPNFNPSLFLSHTYLPYQITNIINRHAASIQKRSDHDQFFMNTNAIMQLVQR